MYITDNKLYFNDFSLTTVKEIPKGNWLVCYNSDTQQFYLKKKQDFTLPEKIYGDTKALCAKYLNTFKNRDTNMGVLLGGLKGTGKSLLSRALCIESNLPVLIVSEPYSGTAFMDLLSNIKQEVVIFMDEFEKVYRRDSEDVKSGNASASQEGMLSILDGMFQSKILFLLTVNQINSINENMINRPGRIHYFKRYDGLTNEFISEVLDDKLKNKDHKAELLQICNVLGEMSMDMLSSLIAECNLYPNQSPRELYKDLNLKPASTSYEVTVSKPGYKDNKFNTYANIFVARDIRTHLVPNDTVVSEDMIDEIDKLDGNIMVQMSVSDPEVKIAVDTDSIVLTKGDETVRYKKEKQYQFVF